MVLNYNYENDDVTGTKKGPQKKTLLISNIKENLPGYKEKGVKELFNPENVSADVYRKALAPVLYHARLQERTGEKKATKLIMDDHRIDEIIEQCRTEEKIDFQRFFKDALSNNDVLKEIYEEILNNNAFLQR